MRRPGSSTFLRRLLIYPESLSSLCDMLVMTNALPSSQVIMEIRDQPGQRPALCRAAEMEKGRVRRPHVSWESQAPPWRWTWWAGEGVTAPLSQQPRPQPLLR